MKGIKGEMRGDILSKVFKVKQACAKVNPLDFQAGHTNEELLFNVV